ncbi:MAG: hypothetical protein O2949_06640 [Proteobacteria bacterium]|nr:hypothetical protein [Pseudomonadota bacterium]
MDWQSIDLKTAFLADTVGPDVASDSHFIVVSDGDILGCDEHDIWQPLSEDELRWAGLTIRSRHFLGWVNDSAIFAVEVDSDSDEPEGYYFESLWTFLNAVNIDLFYLIGRAKQIVEWFRTHQFCGQCGSETTRESQDRSRKCQDCGLMFYPRLSPLSVSIKANRYSWQKMPTHEPIFILSWLAL